MVGVRVGWGIGRLLGVAVMAIGLAATAGSTASAHAWSLSVDDTTMAWSLGLTADALDMLSTAVIAAARGDDPGTVGQALPDPANPDEGQEYLSMSVRTMRLMSHVGLDVFPLDGPRGDSRVSVFRFDAVSGQGAAEDAGWHDAISFSSNCPGCAGETDTTLDLVADFTLPPPPEAEP